MISPLADIRQKLDHISKSANLERLSNQNQDKEIIRQYYDTNKLPYRLFHNRSAYLHMGISSDGRYRRSDLLEQARMIGNEADNSSVAEILELGYGRGANLSLLATKFPTKHFTGIDLSTEPLPRYRRDNIEFIRLDYDRLSALNKQYDLIYGIETVCHSLELGNTLAEIASTMETGGKLILFDGYYLKRYEELDMETRSACRLAEHGMAVDHFHHIDDLKRLAAEKGLRLIKEENLSENILPSLHRFERMARVYFQTPFLARLTSRLLPEMFVRNALSGYLMPELIKAKIAGYYLHIFIK